MFIKSLLPKQRKKQEQYYKSYNNQCPYGKQAAVCRILCSPQRAPAF